VQAHSGTLGVQSRLGRGSVFTVTLPLAGAPGSGMTGEYPVVVAADGADEGMLTAD
jgi:hypothetical protein